MVKQKEGRDWTETCLMRPLKQTEALSAQHAHPPGCSAVGQNNPCSTRKPLTPSLPTATNFTSLNSGLTSWFPSSEHHTCPSNTFTQSQPQQGWGNTSALRIRSGAHKKGKSAEQSPALPSTPALVGLEHSTLVNGLAAALGWAAGGGWALCLQLINYNFISGSVES